MNNWSTLAKSFAFLLVVLGLSACDTQAPISEADDLGSVAAKSSADLLIAPPAGFEMPDPAFIALTKGNQLAKLTAAVEKKGGTVTFAHEATGFAVIRGISDKEASQLKASKLVSSIEADFSFPMNVPKTGETLNAQIDSPTDPTTAYFYPRQWNMRAIDADEAWAAGKLGDPSVTVAVLDTGIDYTYPDLEGLVDLSRSISFVPEDDAYVDYYFPGRHPISDIGYHGTHVAATIASNAYVAAGVTSMTTLIGVKVCSVATGGCPSSAVIAGVLYAADHGADVINMSLGGYFTKAGSKGYVGYVNQAFNYARRQGALVVVSAGNDAVDMDHYNGESIVRDGVTYELDPSTYKTYCSAPTVACVSSTGPTNYSLGGPNDPEWENVDAPADYTNYGRSAVNVAAPGGNASYVYAGCSQTSLVYTICQTGNYIVGLAGTSMAAPHTSGLAALLAAEGYRAPQILTRIQQTADDLGQRGTDPYYGKGRINVADALGL